MQDRILMPTQDHKTRINNFTEVNLGLADEQAINEAKRCLQCKVPLCEHGCPVNVPIKDFISLIRNGKTTEAIAKIKEKNMLPGICGRVCPQETQCEEKCVLNKAKKPIAIGHLERFCADNEIKKPVAKIKIKKKKIAVVGSGPSGLTCAAQSAMFGHNVTIFEALHKPGGVLSYGIPDFRLPKKIVDDEIDYIKSLGVKFEFNSLIGNLYTLDELSKEFDAVFIGTGAGVPIMLNIPGEDLIGVYSANEFLTRINLMKAGLFPKYDTPIKIGKKIIVVGGGNVALDAARVARRFGAEVSVLYRRNEIDMPARREEIVHAKEEGINFIFLSAPIEIVGKEHIEKIKCIKMNLIEDKETKKNRPVPIPGSEFEIICDEVICAVGTTPNKTIQRTAKEIYYSKNGEIIVDSSGKTNLPNVFAGGDITSGSATVIKAMGDGKRAAIAINKLLGEISK
ncbi:MAG: NADPH-dependent glutamate synthase [archaeon]